MNKESSSDGIGVFGLLGVAFVVLKLTGVIDWSWWWVTCPFWIGLAIIGVFILISVLAVNIQDWVLSKRRSKKLKELTNKYK